MGTDDRLIAVHKEITEIATNVQWIMQDRKEAGERIKIFNEGRRSFKTYAAVIGTPLLLSAGVFLANLTKNVDILVALHKPQMQIFYKANKNHLPCFPGGTNNGD